MRRSHLLTALLVAIVATASAVFYFTRTVTPKSDLPARSYAAGQNWDVLPATATPPVWETGWQTDVFLILQANFVRGHTEEKFLANAQKAQMTTKAHADAVASFGAVYAPLMRFNHAEDVSAALDTYLTEHNKGRAFIIITDMDIVADLSQVMGSDNHGERFGGYYHTRNDPLSVATPCPPHLLEQCLDTIELLKTKDTVSLASSALNSTNGLYEEFQTYLRTEIHPMAEPLGEFEEVEIISTNKPKESFKELP